MSNNPEQFTQELSSDQVRYLQEQPTEMQLAFYHKNNQSRQFDPIEVFQALSNEAKTILWSTAPTESPHRTTIQQAPVFQVTEEHPAAMAADTQDSMAANIVPDEKVVQISERTTREQKLLLVASGIFVVGALGLLLVRPTTSPGYEELKPTKKPSSTPVVPTSTNLPPTTTPTPTITFTPENKVIVQVPTETGTPTPTPTATRDLEATIEALNKLLAEAQATKPPTVIPTATATLIPATPTAVPVPIQMTEAPGQKTATPEFYVNSNQEVSSFHLPLREFAVLGKDGIAHLDLDAFRAYFSTSIRNKGVLPDGGVDYLAQMLATPIGEDGMTLSNKLNFWMDPELGGLGWQGDEKLFAGVVENGVNWKNWFSKDRRINGYGVLVPERDFEKVIAQAAVSRYIIGANKQDLSISEIKEFLKKEDGEIQFLFQALVSQTGYRARGLDKTVKTWPGAVAVFDLMVNKTEIPNLVGDEGVICLKVMDKADSREEQLETTGFTTYTNGLENNPKNDETPNQNDSNSEVVIFITFDQEADASSGGAYSPNGKGKIRATFVRFANIEDRLSKKVETPDDSSGKRVKIDGSPSIDCGPQKSTNEVQTPVPKKPEDKVTPPPKETPGTPMKTVTPPPEETPKTPEHPTVTPAATNKPETAPTLPPRATDAPQSTLIPAPEPTQVQPTYAPTNETHPEVVPTPQPGVSLIPASRENDQNQAIMITPLFGALALIERSRLRKNDNEKSKKMIRIARSIVRAEKRQ